MRAVFALLLVGACTPDIVSGSYLCGPNGACPADLACNGPDNTCVLASTVEPFTCDPDVQTEPDDSADTAHLIKNLDCLGVAYVAANCMLQGDAEDWVKLTAPMACANISLDTRVTFTVAFEPLVLELWDLDANMQVGGETTCPNTGENGEELRCLKQSLTPGKSYGIKVRPTGDNDCGGKCPYNRYTLRVQLSTSG